MIMFTIMTTIIIMHILLLFVIIRRLLCHCFHVIIIEYIINYIITKYSMRIQANFVPFACGCEYEFTEKATFSFLIVCSKPEPNMLKILLISYSFQHFPKNYPSFLFYSHIITYYSHIIFMLYCFRY